jgi:GT2 family glycosyltransferase
MFSVVCVYNKKDVFDSLLLKSLLRQTVPYELIAIDNSKNQYPSVTGALNEGGRRATGKYIMFVHQDVDFLSPTWLEEAERTLDALPNLGAAGVAGARREGGKDFNSHLVGWIQGIGGDWGKKIMEPVKVQTFDELILMTPRELFLKTFFDDKTFDFIHLFSSDYCLTVAKKGYDVYVIPGYLLHQSGGSFAGIDKYRLRLLWKHRDQLPIYTSCGKISYGKAWQFFILAYVGRGGARGIRKIRDRFRSWVK